MAVSQRSIQQIQSIYESKKGKKENENDNADGYAKREYGQVMQND